MRYALINNETKKVVNIIIWEGAEWLPPRNHIVIQSDQASIGDTYDESQEAFIGKTGTVKKKPSWLMGLFNGNQ